jgi:hypothetical protein
MKLKQLLVDDGTHLTNQELLVLEYAFLIDVIDDESILTESSILDLLKGKLDGLTDKFKEWGFEFHNTKPGLIQVLAKGGKTLVKSFLLGLAATQAKASGDKEKFKNCQIQAKDLKGDIQKAFSQQNVIDVLLQLDTATAHLITGPLHMVSALTGVHIVLPWESKDAHAAHGNAGGHHEPGITDIIKSLKSKIEKVLPTNQLTLANKLLNKVVSLTKTTK